jgi:hypothetical protein
MLLEFISPAEVGKPILVRSNFHLELYIKIYKT